MTSEAELGEKQAPHRLDISGSSGQWVFLIGAGICATTSPQSASLSLPLRNLLESAFHAPVGMISPSSGSRLLPGTSRSSSACYLIPFRLLGRRDYVLLSATVAGTLWLLAGQMQRSYLLLLAALQCYNKIITVLQQNNVFHLSRQTSHSGRG
jgi:hypothetical protein